MGLLDWITDGGGSLFSEGSAGPMTGNAMPPPMSAQMPPAQGLDTAPTPPPAPQMTGDFDQNGLPPPSAAPPPPPAAGAPAPGAAPPPYNDAAGMGGTQSPPPVPMPQARPDGAPPPVPGAVPPPPPETPPGQPMNIGPSPSYPGLAVAQPSQMPPGTPFSPPDMQGRSGLLAAMGLNSDVANRARGSVGAGLKAAGNSAGKSPFQALSSGAGEALEGGQKASDTNNDQTLKYLNAAINAKKAGDTATYNTNYTKYLAAKLKADTDKAASGNAKGDSPTQLYLSAVRATNSDPTLKGYNDAIRAARANGDPAAIAKAQADLEQAKGGIMNGHLGRLGLDPKTAAQIGQQPGMTETNPINGKAAGLTPESIKKLQPGQFYTNPKDGKLYQYKGSAVKGVPDKPTSPAPRDPQKPEKGTRADAADATDDGET